MTTKKQSTYLWLLLSGVLLLCNRTARAQSTPLRLGLTGNIGAAKVTGIPQNEFYKTHAMLCFTTGLTSLKMFNEHIGAGVNLTYAERGYGSTKTFFGNKGLLLSYVQATPHIRYALNNNYLETGVDVGYRIRTASLPRFKRTEHFGIDDFEKLNVGISLSIGRFISENTVVHISLNQGLSKVGSYSITDDNGNVTGTKSLRNFAFQAGITHYVR